ncbi:ankyrin repeat protein [Trichoderma guizhouense]|uniref:Ankyrin repeat protein n=1 Tax=Trichoderma guizhouense TaxID=1491466 RepID=A0A1T3D034_9HYPO|nr:ankyrin repeat protein [Trichoderma guizhouense]
MMKQAQTLPQKSLTVQKRFISLIKHLEENEIWNDIYSRDAIDALDRFYLWAGNLGALREPNSQLSLENRLAEAPEIRIHIHRQLDNILESIDDVATIVQQKQTSYELEEDNKDMEHLDGLGDTQEGPSEEIRTNFELISVFLKALFRIAVLVRKENPDTRFERAIRSSKCTFPPTFDIDHVREKYPKLKAKEQSWLAERLGKAIARRRQFIKYCRDHRDRLALDDENIEAERATTVMQSSKATTLDPEKIHVATNFAVDDYEDELVSNLSISTSTTTDVLSTLTLPRLADLSKDGEAFECPICFTLRYIKGERSWRYV